MSGDEAPRSVKERSEGCGGGEDGVKGGMKGMLHTNGQQFCQCPQLNALCVSDASTCMMSDWITWSPCSVSCGMGTRSRERYVKQFPEDGSMCKVPTEETEKCIVNEECCKYFIQLYKIQPVAGALPESFFI